MPILPPKRDTVTGLFPRVPGPGVSDTLSVRVTDAMHRKAHANSERDRRESAMSRYFVWSGEFRDQVLAAVKRRYDSQEIRTAMEPFVSTKLNPLQDFVRELAVTYKVPARRYLKDANDDLNKLWKDTLRDAHIDVLAPKWNREALALGPILVVPTYRGASEEDPRARGRLVFETVRPHQYSVQINPLDPGGPIYAALWTLGHGTKSTEDSKTAIAMVMVDREAWHYYNAEGMPVPGPEGEHRVEHGIVDETGQPACPAVVCRFNVPGDPDWWTHSEYDRLVDSTIDANVVWTRLETVRKVQDSFTFFVFAQHETILADGQLIGGYPEGAVQGFHEQANSVRFGAVNAQVDPAAHLKHIEAIYQLNARSYGIPLPSISFDFGGADPAVMIKMSAERRAQLRSEQLPFARTFDRRLAVIVASTLDGRPGFQALPKPREMFERSIVEYPEPASMEDQREQREQDKWELSQGLISQVDILMRRRPELTRAEALEELKRNVQDEQGPLHEIFATRNQPRNDPPVMSAAEANGRTGPALRDGVPLSDDDGT